MTRYEIKKVFSGRSSKIAVLLLLAVMGLTCYFAADVFYVNGQGERVTGPKAVAALKAAQKEWSGYLDEEKIRRVIAENLRIQSTPEALSQDETKREIAYSWQQGIEEIRNLLNYSYASGFRDYDYYRADSLTEADAVHFYENRTLLLKEWLADEAAGQFSEKEKEFLISRYENIQTPLYMDYMKGWERLFEYAPTIVMITMLILGYLVAGIFSSEFTWKSDAVFFTSFYGRNKAVLAKIKAGFFIVTVGYSAAFLLYTGILLLYFGIDGWNLAVQTGAWKCFYNITNWQKYVLIFAGGYIGCLFITVLSMAVSAKTRSAVLAVMIPVLLIFIPSFISNINSPAVNKIIGLLPDQLLQTGMALNYFNLYSPGGKIFGEVPVLMVLYSVFTAALFPVLYQVYRKK